MAPRTKSTGPSPSKRPWPTLPLFVLLTLIIPVGISIILYINQPKDFNPVKFVGYSFEESIQVPYKHDRIVSVSERIGEGLLPGPEDFAYDAQSGHLYTSCSDGWVRRVKLREDDDGLQGPLVEDWARLTGRPLGLALASHGTLVVADADTGLFLVNKNKEIQLLTDEAEGLKFRLTDGVDVASDGMIYFTDGSYKYNLHDHMLDILEGWPHGRLMSFNPSTNQTVVLVHGLYFANGVTLSPDQRSLIFCETAQRRCQKYHILGEKKGAVEIFIDNLPGFPDNIRYDGEGHYWIALAVGRTRSWDTLVKYPLLRKITAVLGTSLLGSELGKDSGVLSVGLDGKPLAVFSDSGLFAVTVGLKIGKYLYHGSLIKPYISRIDLTKFVW